MSKIKVSKLVSIFLVVAFITNASAFAMTGAIFSQQEKELETIFGKEITICYADGEKKISLQDYAILIDVLKDCSEAVKYSGKHDNDIFTPALTFYLGNIIKSVDSHHQLGLKNEAVSDAINSLHTRAPPIQVI